AVRGRGGGGGWGGFEGGRGGVVPGRPEEGGGGGGAERPASADVRGTEHRVADALDEPHVGGQARLARPHLRQDGAEVRGVGRGGVPPGQQVVHRVEVVADVPGVGHRADEAEPVGEAREAGLQFGNAHARHGGGGRSV